jgi:RNA polymerase sigma-70 factor (ECF subfamily)
MEKDDAQLISEYLAGEESSFRVLVERHVKPVFNFVLRLTGSSQDAEDISQEAFIKVWRNLRKYRGGQSFKVWLYTIARRTAIDWLRRKRHLPFSIFDDEEGSNALVETLADDSPLPDEMAAAAEDRAVLSAAISRLPACYRQVLSLRCDGECDFTEIGQIIGRPQNTVRSQYQRAVAILRRLLGDGAR